MNNNKKRLYLLAAGVAAITFLVYLSCLRNEFVLWDDDAYIVDNPFIRSFDWSFLKWAFFKFYAYNWHPLTWISHALDYAVWGLNPLGHHLSNIALHAMDTFLVVVLAAKLLTAPRSAEHPLDVRSVLVAAGVTGLLFGLHPVHVESVAWVSERKDVLSGLFFLGCLLLYADYARDLPAQPGLRAAVSDRRYWGTLGLFVLALLSKPMAVSLPVVLLVLDWYPFGRIRSVPDAFRAFVEKLPFVALALLSSIVTVAAQRAGGSLNLNELIPLHSRLLLAAKALFGYLQKMLWPEGLVPFYPYPTFTSIRSLEYSLPLLGIVAVTAACIVLSRKQKVWLAVWVCYIIMLIPVLGIVQVGHQAMADRYTYLPSFGPFLLAGLGAARLSSLAKGPSGRIAVVAGGGVLLALLSYGTLKQIPVWNNSITLWTSVILRYPAIDTLPYHNRALGYNKLGMYREALQDFSRALEIDPFDADLYNKRALAYEGMGRLDLAIADYDRSLSLNPSSSDTYNNLGVLYAKQKAYAKAIESFDRALSLKPNDTDSLVNRGMAYGLTGSFDQALQDFDRAVALAPNLAAGYYARGKLYLKMGRQDPAAADFSQACRLGITDACNPL